MLRKADQSGRDKLLRNILIGAIIVGILLLLALLVALGFGARWYFSPENKLSIVQRRDLVQGMASAGQALAVFLTGAVGLLGLFFTWQNTSLARKSTQRTLELTAQGQITDRFTKAIDQLGKTDDTQKRIGEIRLGGIYALAQIAVEAPKEYHWTIMQIFTAYLQTYTSWQGDGLVEPESDIEAILNALGRRDRSHDPEGERLLLMDLDLSNYTFPDRVHLAEASLINTHIESATLRRAFLQGADLRGAHLQGANLGGADLSSADLRWANLEGAYLYNANLKDADLSGAHLSGSYLAGAKLLEAKNLDPESLKQANGQTHPGWATEVVEGIRPPWWTRLPHDESWEREQKRKQLNPGEYSIKVSSSPLYFRVGEGWSAILNLPYGFSLTRTGAVLSLRSERWVCDPQQPNERYALKPARKDMLNWFLDHPWLDKKNLGSYKVGGVPAMQFDAEISAPDDKLLATYGSPALPLFPQFPRSGPFVLMRENRNRIIVVTQQNESMVIIIESSPDAFDEFYERVERVLDTVYWSENPGEQPGGGP